MEAGGDGSQGPGVRSSGDPKEQDVLSARPSPSEPGLASESEEEKRGTMVRKKPEKRRRVGFTRHIERALERRLAQTNCCVKRKM